VPPRSDCWPPFRGPAGATFRMSQAPLRLELEIFVAPCVHWLLDCLDWRLVRDFFGDLRTLPLNDGAVVVLRCDDPPQ
jgi:hypothetical protein